MTRRGATLESNELQWWVRHAPWPQIVSCLRNKGDYTEQSAFPGLSYSDNSQISGALQSQLLFIFHSCLWCWLWLCPHFFSRCIPDWGRHLYMRYAVSVAKEKQLGWCRHVKACKAPIRHNLPQWTLYCLPLAKVTWPSLQSMRQARVLCHQTLQVKWQWTER